MKKDFQTLYPLSAFRSVPSPSEGISITRLEDRLDPLVPFPHKHDFYQLILITAGAGKHEIDFHSFPARRGHFFRMRPAEIHAWEFNSKAKGLVVEFGRATLESKDVRLQPLYLMLEALPTLIELKAAPCQAIEHLLEAAFDENKSRAAGFELCLLSLLMQLLIELSRAANLPGIRLNENTEVSARFFALLEENFREQHGAGYYAQRLGLSTRALAMRFAREGLESPQSLIHSRCLLEAKRLLAYSDLPIAMIGEQLGFEDANYFTRLFRQKVGTTPGAFRAES